jgi:phage baseplate assembly protein W
MTAFGFPYRIGADGTTATATREAQIRHMVENVLMTARGERRNRPDFGAGIRDMLFTENSPEIAAAAQALVEGALHQWLAGVIELRAVRAEARGSLLEIHVSYALPTDPRPQSLVVEVAP